VDFDLTLRIEASEVVRLNSFVQLISLPGYNQAALRSSLLGPKNLILSVIKETAIPPVLLRPKEFDFMSKMNLQNI